MRNKMIKYLLCLETLASCGYLSRKALKLYYEVRKMTVPELIRPHLVIYLDCPVNVCLQKIKKRNLPHEVNSPVYTPEYLTNMETIYKQQYLKQMSNHARILVYDWSEEGDAEVVVEDIERVNFELDKHASGNGGVHPLFYKNFLSP
ncbi:Ndufa10p [Halocaridina rubra]|uniref:Ndufa10p n=1 Tax=Halocaridina rubra TaxID=373956 RepID=A0AAN9AGD8_HALRR